MEVGERILWLIRGPEATLACLISGLPPTELRWHLESVLSEIHTLYAPELVNYQGDRSVIGGVVDVLDRALTMEYRVDPQNGRRRLYWPWILGFILVLGLLGWQWWRSEEQRQRLAAVEQRLSAEPGIVVVDWKAGERGIDASLLRDPLAPNPSTLVTDPELRNRINISITPFQSLEPELVLERARRLLRTPAGVELRLDDGTLLGRGTAPPQWLEPARASPVLPPGVEHLDLSAVVPDLSGLPAAVHSALQPPPGVTLSLKDRSLTIGGVAPWAWINTVALRLHRIDEVEDCRYAELRIKEWEELQTLVGELESSQVYFVDGRTPVPEAPPVMQHAARIADRLAALDATLRAGLKVRVIGNSDGLGTKAWNESLRHQRANMVRDVMIEQGVPSDVFALEVDPVFKPSLVPLMDQRRVDFSVAATAPSLPPCLP